MSTTDTQLAISPITSKPNHGIDFFNPEQFVHAQRVAQIFSQSVLVPDNYKGNIGNCVIALDIAARTGSSPTMVMQNLHVIHGKPSWSGQYIIAAINSSGRYTPLRYEITDLGEIEYQGKKLRNKQVVAYAWERSSPDAWGKKELRLESAPVSVEIAIKEGWFDRKGTKWWSMTDLMLQYRAATWFGRMYAPEILMGMETQEEVIDVAATPVVDDAANRIADAVGLPAGGTTSTPEASTAEAAKRTRKPKGAAAAAASSEAPPIDVATQASTTTPAPTEGKPEEKSAEKPADKPASDPAKTETPAPANPPAKTETPATPPSAENPPTGKQEKIRTEVEEVVGAKTPAGIISKLTLSGVKGHVYFDKPPADAPPIGAIIDVVIGERASKTDPNIKIPILLSFEVIGG